MDHPYGPGRRSGAGGDEVAPIRPAPFVERIVSASGDVPDLLFVMGYPGAAARDGATRLYLAADLGRYCEISAADIVAHEVVTTVTGPAGLVAVWYRRSADVVIGGRDAVDPRARFLTGDLTEQYMAGVGAGAGWPAVDPVESTVTQAECAARVARAAHTNNCPVCNTGMEVTCQHSASVHCPPAAAMRGGVPGPPAAAPGGDPAPFAPTHFCGDIETRNCPVCPTGARVTCQHTAPVVCPPAPRAMGMGGYYGMAGPTTQADCPVCPTGANMTCQHSHHVHCAAWNPAPY